MKRFNKLYANILAIRRWFLMATLGFVIPVLVALFVLSFVEFLSVLNKNKESDKNREKSVLKGKIQLERINLNFKSILKSLDQ